MKIICSIKDKWFQLIASGEKTIEVRKSVPNSFINRYHWQANPRGNKPPFYIYWYNTKTKRIEGRSEFLGWNNTEEYKIMEQWEHLTTGQLGTCLDREGLEKYMNGWDSVVLWSLGTYETLEPFALPKDKRTPQSWCYYDTIMGG